MFELLRILFFCFEDYKFKNDTIERNLKMKTKKPPLPKAMKVKKVYYV